MEGIDKSTELWWHPPSVQCLKWLGSVCNNLPICFCPELASSALCSCSAETSSCRTPWTADPAPRCRWASWARCRSRRHSPSRCSLSWPLWLCIDVWSEKIFSSSMLICKSLICIDIIRNSFARTIHTIHLHMQNAQLMCTYNTHNSFANTMQKIDLDIQNKQFICTCNTQNWFALMFHSPAKVIRIIGPKFKFRNNLVIQTNACNLRLWLRDLYIWDAFRYLILFRFYVNY